jgi:predicted  nucleic acid-binding Zn-ribbon protein
MSFAQTDVALNVEKADTTAKELLTPQERIIKLEKDIEFLKASHQDLHKQLAEIKAKLPVQKKRKLVVSRVGSKQGVWVEE